MRCSGKGLAKVAISAVLSTFLIPKLFGAPAQWVKLETPHFELYTTAGEKKGREAILYFEQVRSFFLQASPSKHAPEFPVRIVAFRSESQYKPYRMNDSAVAYYTPGRDRDYIVMEDISAEHYPAAIHEYTHLIVKHAGLKLPLWLNEGWADLYSSLTPKGNKAEVGVLLPGRVQTLLNTKWLPLDVLASVDHNSPMYNERDKAGIFYAESWLLAHMLYLSPEYRTNFTQFVLALAKGQDTAQSFQSVYGKELKVVADDLNRYIKGGRFFAVLFDVKLEKSSEDPRVSDVSAFDAGLLLADLLSMVHKPEEARLAYRQLAQENPGQPEVQEALGYMEWHAGNQESARQYFSQAFASGTKSAQMCYDYAVLESQTAGGGKTAIPILRRAVELKPDYVAARLQLGLLLTSERSYSEALDQLHQIQKIDPEQAPAYFLALAYSDLNTGHKDEARKNAESAKKWAKAAGDSEQADSLLRYLDESKASSTSAASAQPLTKPGDQQSADNTDDRPTLRHRPEPGIDGHETAHRNPFVKQDDQMNHVEGMADSLECDGQSARFYILVGKTRMVFEIPNPSGVLIKHSGEAHHDFTCGVQKPFPVAVDYAVKPDAKKGTAGIVRELDF
jgi:tetratricopeptide (TPR) repeat protein